MDVREASKLVENPKNYQQTVIKNFLKVNQNNVQLMSLPKIPVMPTSKKIPKLLKIEKDNLEYKIHKEELDKIA
jgi:hypothetical protein